LLLSSSSSLSISSSDKLPDLLSFLSSALLSLLILRSFVVILEEMEAAL
jgi:hypothetical protein